MKIILVFISFAFMSNVFAQQYYTSGKVILATGDTLYGWIDSRGEFRNTKICTFKENRSAEPQEFKPFEIIGYRFSISGRYYVSRSVVKEQNNKKENEDLFVEFILDGDIKLFYYVDLIGAHYLLEMPDNQMFELTNESTDYMKDGLRYPRTTNKYKGILKAALRDEPEIFPFIDKMEFKRSHFIKAITQYHKLKDREDMITIYEQEPEENQFAITGYYDHSWPEGFLYGSNLNSESVFNLQKFLGFGAFLEYVPSRLNGKFYLRLGFNYTEQEYFTEFTKPNLTTNFVYQIKTNLVAYGVPFSFGVYFPTQRVKYFAGLGYTHLFRNLEAETLRFQEGEPISSAVIYEDGTFNNSGYGAILSAQIGAYVYFTDRLALFTLADYRNYRANAPRDFEDSAITAEDFIRTSGPGLNLGVHYDF